MFNKENKKSLCHHDILAWIIIALLTFILISLVFKIGIMVGSSKAGFSSCKKAYYHKDKKFIIEQYEAKAEAMGMTLEEFKKYLMEQGKIKYEKLEEDKD